jgi:hypothetical protein
MKSVANIIPKEYAQLTRHTRRTRRQPPPTTPAITSPASSTSGPSGVNDLSTPGYNPFPATTLHIPCPMNFWKFDKGESPETSDTSNIKVESDGVSVAFQSSVSTTPSNSSTYRKPFRYHPNQARHKIGPSHPALHLQKFPLPFFSLLPRFTTYHPPHNRTVCL